MKKFFDDKLLSMTSFLSFVTLLAMPAVSKEIDWKTIVTLGTLLILVTLYEELGILRILATKILKFAKNDRQLIAIILMVTIIGAMFVTNDVIILTMIPLIFSIKRLQTIPYQKFAVYTIILSNLGSSLSPFGNPQNIFLSSFYHLELSTFFKMTLPVLGFVTIIFLWAVLTTPKNMIKIELMIEDKSIIKTPKTLVVLSFLILMSVLGFLPLWLGLIFAILVAILNNIKCLQKVDYSILIIFINFFIITAGIRKSDVVEKWITQNIHTPQEILISSSIFSQLISNVPSTIFLSHFTSQNYALYLGVTIGGLGTLVASLANLLAYRQYKEHCLNKQELHHFFKAFTKVNVVLFLLFIFISFFLV